MESKLIRELLSPLDTVAEVKISLTDRRVNVEHDDKLAPEEIVDILNRKHLGASLQEQSVVQKTGTFTHSETVRLILNTVQMLFYVLTLALPILGYHKAAYGMAWICVSLSFALFHEAYLAVRRLSPNVEVMMAIAMAGALLQDEVVEAATVGTLVTLMDLVKMFALESVARKLRGVVVSEPLSVDVPGGGTVLLSELAVGDVYMLRVGDIVPADGTIIVGRVTIDESRVTGEAMPQAKRMDDRVVSGGVVSSGYVHVRTEAPVSASFQVRMADAVEDAQNTLSHIEELVGRFASWYTPIVLGLAVALGFYKGLQQFLVVIVAGCPCALLGAAPFVQAATITLLARRHRLLVKHATTLEYLAAVRTLGFDKTGTLTTGAFELMRFDILPGAAHSRDELHRWVAAVEEQDNHPIARSLVASYKGCIADFHASGASLPPVTGYQRHGRHGVSATVEGRRVGVGNADFLRASLTHDEAAVEEDDEDPDMPLRLRKSLQKKRQKEKEEKATLAALAGDDVDSRANQPAALPDDAAAALRLVDAMALEQAGSGTVLAVIVDGVVAGVMLLDDALKPNAVDTVTQLMRLGVRPILLTGDRQAAAQRVASAVGISDADTHAALLPEDKQRHILAHTWPAGQAGEQHPEGAPPAQDLEASMLPKARRGPLAVGFVGDGLNDCPALASAHVGVVLQEVGSQATVDAASAVLQVGIEQLPAAIIIARRARSLVLTNLFLALGINVGVIALAATIGLPLWLSVLSDTGGLLVVLANSLWPLTWRVGGGAEAPVGSKSDPADSLGPPSARPNVRALAATMLLSASWTVAQLVGAHVANSSSLLSDALAMLVDDSAYAFNLWAELRPDQERAIKLAAPLISAVVLLVVTARSFSGAIATLQGGDAAADDEAVDGPIVLGFGVAMLLVDMMMLRAILFRGGRNGGEDAAAGADSSWSLLGRACHVCPRTELNLFSCLSHVVADTLRSLTQVVVGTVIMTGVPSEGVDAYGTLAISGIILLGTAFLLSEVASQLFAGP